MWGRSFDSWGFIRNLKWSHTFSFIEMNICAFFRVQSRLLGIISQRRTKSICGLVTFKFGWYDSVWCGSKSIKAISIGLHMHTNVCGTTNTPIVQIYYMNDILQYRVHVEVYICVQATFKWIEMLLLFVFHIFFRLVVLCMALVYDDCLDSAYTWFSAFFL